MSKIDESGIKHNSFYETDKELGFEPRTEEELMEYKRLIGMSLAEDYDELISSYEKEIVLKMDTLVNTYIKFSKQNLVDSAIELHNELNGSNWDLDELRRIYSKTSVSDCFAKDNPGNCDAGSVISGPVLKKIRK